MPTAPRHRAIALLATLMAALSLLLHHPMSTAMGLHKPPQLTLLQPHHLTARLDQARRHLTVPLHLLGHKIRTDPPVPPQYSQVEAVILLLLNRPMDPVALLAQPIRPQHNHLTAQALQMPQQTLMDHPVPAQFNHLVAVILLPHKPHTDLAALLVHKILTDHQSNPVETLTQPQLNHLMDQHHRAATLDPKTPTVLQALLLSLLPAAPLIQLQLNLHMDHPLAVALLDLKTPMDPQVLPLSVLPILPRIQPRLNPHMDHLLPAAVLDLRIRMVLQALPLLDLQAALPTQPQPKPPMDLLQAVVQDLKTHTAPQVLPLLFLPVALPTQLLPKHHMDRHLAVVLLDRKTPMVHQVPLSFRLAAPPIRPQPKLPMDLHQAAAQIHKTPMAHPVLHPLQLLVYPPTQHLFNPHMDLHLVAAVLDPKIHMVPLALLLLCLLAAPHIPRLLKPHMDLPQAAPQTRKTRMALPVLPLPLKEQILTQLLPTSPLMNHPRPLSFLLIHLFILVLFLCPRMDPLDSSLATPRLTLLQTKNLLHPPKKHTDHHNQPL